MGPTRCRRKKRFEPCSEEINVGKLTTVLFRQKHVQGAGEGFIEKLANVPDQLQQEKTTPITKSESVSTSDPKAESTPHYHRSLFEQSITPDKITPSEWEYLKKYMDQLRSGVAARNQIITGLISWVSNPENKGRIEHSTLTNLAIRAAYNYLCATYQNVQFRLTVWRPRHDDRGDVIENVAQWPPVENAVNRSIDAYDVRYYLVRTLNGIAPAIIPNVNNARLRGEWFDFDPKYAQGPPRVNSVLLLPIYRIKNKNEKIWSAPDKPEEVLGVLTVVSDKPEFFILEEIDLWRQTFIGYLGNLALAESLFRTTV